MSVAVRETAGPAAVVVIVMISSFLLSTELLLSGSNCTVSASVCSMPIEAFENI